MTYQLPHRDLEVSLRFLTTAEGGRKSPLLCDKSSYRPLLRLGEDLYGTEFDFSPLEEVQPGDVVTARVGIIFPEARTLLLERAEVSDKVEVCEGPKVVAVGEITKILAEPPP